MAKKNQIRKTENETIRGARRSGSSRNYRDYRLAQKIERISEISKDIDEVELRIRQIGYLLRRSQPNGYGMIDVRWWKNKKDKSREPVLVRWFKKDKYSNEGTVREYTKRPKVNRWGEWEMCADETEELVNLFFKLKKLWVKLSEKFEREVSLNAGRKISVEELVFVDMEIDKIMNSVDEKQKKAGYLGGVKGFEEEVLSGIDDFYVKEIGE